MKTNRKLNEMSRPVGSKIVSLPKYGFVRAPEEDFTDDGARFTAFWYDPEGKGEKNILATKSTYQGEVFISIRYTMPGTSHTEYIDDLNGVSAEVALEKMPDVIKQVEEARKKMTEFTAQKLTDEEIEKFSDEVAERAVSKNNMYELIKVVLQQHGYDLNSLESAVAMKYQKACENKYKVKASAALPKEVIKGLAAELLQRVLGSYHSYWSVDKAIEHAYASIEYDKKRYYLSDLDDATVKRMKDWVKRKLSFNDFE